MTLAVGEERLFKLSRDFSALIYCTVPKICLLYTSGKVDTEFVAVESEHSAMSTCIGASAAGARAITATSSAGLALMWELLYVASSARLPITMAVVNRALTGPININNDHSDSMGCRDTGWIQLYAENNQEAYDNYIQAMPIAEACRLPIMVCQDGFITSHAVENIELLDDADVKAFVGQYEPENYLLKAENPLAVGPYGVSPYYMEVKKAQAEAMKEAKSRILEVGEAYGKLSGRKYGFFEEYRMEDAEAAVVVLGSSAGTGKDAVDLLREDGKKVGLIKLRVFRPFPMEELAAALSLSLIHILWCCFRPCVRAGRLSTEWPPAWWTRLQGNM